MSPDSGVCLVYNYIQKHTCSITQTDPQTETASTNLPGKDRGDERRMAESRV